MRAFVTDADVLLGTTLAAAMLIELRLTQPIYYTTSRDDLVWAGNTYLGGRPITIDQVKDQGGEVLGLSFAMSAVPADNIALALAEPIQGKVALVSLAIMEPAAQRIVDVVLLWTGILDQMPITEQANSATIAATAEHRGIVFARPKGLMYSDADQQRLHPGDRCLEFLAAQASHLDVWPAASWGRQ